MLPRDLAGLVRRPVDPRDRQTPLRRVGAELALAETAFRIIGRLQDEGSATIPDHEPGHERQELLDRACLPVGHDRGSLARRGEHPPCPAGSDQGIGHVHRVDETVAGVRYIEDARLPGAERVGNHVRRRRLEEIVRDSPEQDHVDLQRIDAGIIERLPASGGREFTRLHVRRRPASLPDLGHVFEPAGLEMKAVAEARLLLDLRRRDDGGWDRRRRPR